MSLTLNVHRRLTHGPERHLRSLVRGFRDPIRLALSLSHGAGPSNSITRVRNDTIASPNDRSRLIWSLRRGNDTIT
jgi:hypothetical protein